MWPLCCPRTIPNRTPQNLTPGDSDRSENPGRQRGEGFFKSLFTETGEPCGVSPRTELPKNPRASAARLAWILVLLCFPIRKCFTAEPTVMGHTLNRPYFGAFAAAGNRRALIDLTVSPRLATGSFPVNLIVRGGRHPLSLHT